jgi:hypothetical protein
MKPGLRLALQVKDMGAAMIEDFDTISPSISDARNVLIGIHHACRVEAENKFSDSGLPSGWVKITPELLVTGFGLSLPRAKTALSTLKRAGLLECVCLIENESGAVSLIATANWTQFE